MAVGKKSKGNFAAAKAPLKIMTIPLTHPKQTLQNREKRRIMDATGGANG
jgi:hypothetical protein